MEKKGKTTASSNGLAADVQLMQGMLGLFSQYESRRMSERVKRGIQAKKQRLAAQRQQTQKK
jgi:DNA invertase Pin-like site-specific DNA recombinase